MHQQVALTKSELSSARAIRSTMDARGHLKDVDGFRSACQSSRDEHGEDRHELVKWHALHCKS